MNVRYIKRFLKNPKSAIEMVRDLENEAGALREIFFIQAYKPLQDRIQPKTTLIDIGANIGDTAIYFAMNPNIERVICYEPSKVLYEHSKELVEMSPDKGKIILNNKAVSTNINLMTDYQKRQVGGIETIELEEVLKGKNNVAIKCDCDGGEHSIFTNKTKLDAVYAIMMEYHEGTRDIPYILEEQGFTVKINPNLSWEGVGYIYAEKSKKI